MDIAVRETGNGGEIQVIGNDLSMYFNGENNILLAMFGGNVEQVTKKRIPGEQDFSYWANDLLYPNDPAIQFNSTTEKAFKEIPLTSAGRVLIENAIKNDLKFLSVFGEIKVSVIIVAPDRIDIIINWFTDIGRPRVTTIKIKKTDDGDFFAMDFNDDFL